MKRKWKGRSSCSVQFHSGSMMWLKCLNTGLWQPADIWFIDCCQNKKRFFYRERPSVKCLKKKQNLPTLDPVKPTENTGKQILKSNIQMELLFLSHNLTWHQMTKCQNGITNAVADLIVPYEESPTITAKCIITSGDRNVLSFQPGFHRGGRGVHSLSSPQPFW